MKNMRASLKNRIALRTGGKIARAITLNRAALAFILLILLTLTITAAGCAAKTPTKTTPKPAVTSATVPATTPTIPPTTSTTTKVTTTPTLTQTAFPLLITAPQTYAEYTLPIYLSADDTIHLVWAVSGVGEHIRMSINTPDGKYVGIKAAGGFVALSNDAPCDQLNRSGSIVLKPADQKWVDGYYVFHPYISDKDPTVNVKILYWIEH